MKTDQRSDRHIVFRVDADARIGAGHLIRCRALAHAWQDIGGRATFLMKEPSPGIESSLAADGMCVKRLESPPGSLEDAEVTAGVAAGLNADWLVLDGYHFDGDYQRALKTNGRRLLCVDDYGHADHYYADLILNQNLYAHEGLYPGCEAYTRILIGARYVLLRRRFEKWRNWRRQIPDVARKVLVTMGGSDPYNVTSAVVRALQRLEVPGLKVKVVAGADSPHFEVLRAAVRDSATGMEVLSAVEDMPGLMAWADAAVTAGGSTCWETVFMGLPNCIVVWADNQQPVADILGRLGVSVNMGRFDTLDTLKMVRDIGALIEDPRRRRMMSTVGRVLITGTGSRKVVEAMTAQTAPLGGKRI